MIKIICFGKIKEDYFNMAIEEYLKIIKKYTKIEIIELKDYVDTDKKECLNKEKEELLKHIKKSDNLVIMDINGKEYDSVSFSSFIDKEITYNNNVVFIIGSSLGLHKSIYDLTNKYISFSRLTFPHQLFRVILLEQIYRSYKILNNETYHK